MQNATCKCRIVPSMALIIFLHIVTQAAWYWGKKFLNIKCVFWFFLQHAVWNNSNSKQNRARYDHKRTQDFTYSYNTRYCCYILMPLQIFSNDILKIFKIYQRPWRSVQREPRYSIRTDRLTWSEHFCITNLIHKFLVRSHKLHKIKFNLILCNLCEWTRNLCIKLVIIKKLYYDARPTKYQDLHC